MKSIYRWIAGHPRLAKFIIAVIITVLAFILLNPNVFSFFFTDCL